MRQHDPASHFAVLALFLGVAKPGEDWRPPRDGFAASIKSSHPATTRPSTLPLTLERCSEPRSHTPVQLSQSHSSPIRSRLTTCPKRVLRGRTTSTEKSYEAQIASEQVVIEPKTLCSSWPTTTVSSEANCDGGIGVWEPVMST